MLHSNQARVRVIATAEKDPVTEVAAVFAGRPLPAAEPHGHDHSREVGEVVG